MNVHDLDPTCWGEEDDFAAERAYVKATKRHAQDDAAEYRASGTHIDPMPTFDEFIGGTDDAEC